MKVTITIMAFLLLAACAPTDDPVLVACEYEGVTLEIDPMTDPAFCGVNAECLGGMACIPGLAECVDGACR